MTEANICCLPGELGARGRAIDEVACIIGEEVAGDMLVLEQSAGARELARRITELAWVICELAHPMGFAGTSLPELIGVAGLEVDDAHA